MPGLSNPRVVYDPKPRFLVDKNGITLQLNQLSDGERGLLAIVFDLSRRLAIANPALGDPIHEGKGIVLIDEIELHLHPKWQREALRRLRLTFANCQFIATTHSPQILGEVEDRSVRYLFRDEAGGVQRYTPDQALGLDSNRVLEEIMGTPARNEQVQSFLHDLFRAIDREDFPQAREKMREIGATLGDSDPELVRARSLISFLGGEDEEHSQGR
jgi:predicted ATP-binding protein involved in virulence